MVQVFGTDTYYIQDEGHGHDVLLVPFGLQILVRTLYKTLILIFD